MLGDVLEIDAMAKTERFRAEDGHSFPPAPRVAAPPIRPSIADEFRAAVAQVAAGHVQRVCMPSHWVVWMSEGQTKPRAKIFKNQASQKATLCNCS